MLNKIVDDVLPQHVADNIENLLTGRSFPWFFIAPEFSEVAFGGANQYMIHTFYEDYKVNSTFYNLIEPIIEFINPRALIKIKANLYPFTNTVIEQGFHVDCGWDDNHTAIYYVNDNDGYTKLSDGTKIESVKNRLSILNPLTSHTGSTSTDKSRLTINFNWF